MTENTASPTLSNSELIHWMKRYVSNLIGETYEDVNESTPIRHFDFDSIDSVTMTFELENAFNISITSEYFFDGRRSLSEIATCILDEQ